MPPRKGQDGRVAAKVAMRLFPEDAAEVLVDREAAQEGEGGGRGEATGRGGKG